MSDVKMELRRKAWEALGWTNIRFMKGCALVRSDFAGTNPATGEDDWLGAIESNNGIALDALSKQSDIFGWYWHLERRTHGAEFIEHACRIGNVLGVTESRSVWGIGHTPAEAICKALIAAASSEERK